MSCGWEGNRRSDVALAMHHRLQWSIHLEAHDLDREMSTQLTLSCTVRPIYLYIYVSKWQYHIPEDASESSWCGISWHGVNKWNVGRLNTTQTTSQQLCCQPPTAAVNVTLTASDRCDAQQQLLLIDIFCPQGTQQQTRRTLLPQSIDRTDRQTDRRTDTPPLHRSCSTLYDDSVKMIPAQTVH